MITKLFEEATIRDIVNSNDPNFIHRKKWLKDLKTKTGTVEIDGNNFYLDKVIGGTLYFKIKSAHRELYYDNIVSFSDNYNYIVNSFKFNEYDIVSTVSDRVKLVNDIKYYFKQMIENGDALVYCSCPSNLYAGFAYIGSELDYITRRNKEKRFPKIKNPELKGATCKHLNYVLFVLLNNIKIKKYCIIAFVDNFLRVQTKRKYHGIKDEWWIDYL